MSFYTRSLVVLVSLLAVTYAYADDRETKAIERAHMIVTKDFKDPGSAQFRNDVAYSLPKPKDEKDIVVCGEVNGKNSFGGYVGFQKYYVHEDKAVLRDDPTFYDLFDLLSKVFCVKYDRVGE